MHRREDGGSSEELTLRSGELDSEKGSDEDREEYPSLTFTSSLLSFSFIWPRYLAMSVILPTLFPVATFVPLLSGEPLSTMS